MKTARLLVCAIASAFSVGCMDAEDGSTVAAPSLSFWVEESDYFSPGEVMKACAVWRTVGVSCALAAEAEANTWVRSYEEAGDVYARGSTDGHLIVNVLHANFSGTELGTIIMAHEIGHRMGLQHLPEGVAGVMSPVPTLEAAELTKADLREYWGTR